MPGISDLRIQPRFAAFLRSISANCFTGKWELIFSHFLQNFRISAAKRLLDTGNYKVYEVAEMVGFHDQKYFVTVFKKICGVTPSVYRKERER